MQSGQRCNPCKLPALAVDFRSNGDTCSHQPFCKEPPASRQCFARESIASNRIGTVALVPQTHQRTKLERRAPPPAPPPPTARRRLRIRPRAAVFPLQLADRRPPLFLLFPPPDVLPGQVQTALFNYSNILLCDMLMLPGIRQSIHKIASRELCENLRSLCDVDASSDSTKHTQDSFQGIV